MGTVSAAMRQAIIRRLQEIAPRGTTIYNQFMPTTTGTYHALFVLHNGRLRNISGLAHALLGLKERQDVGAVKLAGIYTCDPLVADLALKTHGDASAYHSEAAYYEVAEVPSEPIE